MKIQRKNSGFTLVEILIVVIILGILAAIVIPQFTEASEEARESTLTSNLQVLRSQVGLYKIQHNDQYPASNPAALATPAGAIAFVDAITGQTDAAHTVAAGNEFGPYMQNIPNNPFVTDAAAPMFEIVDGIAGSLNGSTHWTFDWETGAITANSDQATYPDHQTY